MTPKNPTATSTTRSTNPPRAVPLLVLLLAAAGCNLRDADRADRADLAPPELAEGVTADDLESRIARFAPAEIGIDRWTLEPWERQLVEKLVLASDIMHELFLIQVSLNNLRWRESLAAAGTEEGRFAREYFDIMAGPWDRLEHDEPFLDVGPKPDGAGYYDPDITRHEIERWLSQHPEDRQAFTGRFTVIRREHGMLIAVPYAVAYRERLERAAALLDQAADLSRNESLAAYLRARAASFLSNHYSPSDMAWMDVEDARIEPTIGPSEVHEDRLMGWKAAFESFVTVADPDATAELDGLEDRMPFLEANLPIEDRYKNLERGFESSIRVVDVVYAAGAARAGVQTIALDLPNDERVRAAKGSRKLMLRNVARAKFETVLVPIARAVLETSVAADIDFDAWFTNVLMHELSHGIGPAFVVRPHRDTTTVNRALREHHSALEEAKADVTGLHGMTVLADEGVYDDDFLRRAFLGHVADMFRAARFNANEAHGRANLVQLNWLMERSALRHDPATGRFSVDLPRVIEANRELAARILTIQAEGDYDAAGALLERYGAVAPQIRASLDRLDAVPVDIRPVYTMAATQGD